MIHEFDETGDFYDSMSFSEIVRKKRRLLGLNQTDFAEILGVDTSTVSRWERGLTSPPFEDARRILDFLGFDLKVPIYEGEKAENQEIMLGQIVEAYVRYGITPIAI